MTKINASIVLYHNDRAQLERAINSFLNTELDVKLYLVDNSANDNLKSLTEIDPSRIEYIFNNANIGFGAAHNVAIAKSMQDQTAYHLVLNPDIYYDGGVLEALTEYMDEHKDVGNIIPQVRYPNGEIQYLCKLLPTPIESIFRRFIPFKGVKEKINYRYELRCTGYDEIMNVPSISGCFMFIRTEVLKEVGTFDEKIFMYYEDLDLNRRIHNKYKTIFYPEVEVVHEYGKESYKNKKLLKYHIESAIYYFNKWGWIFDKNRKEINQKALKELRS